VRKSENYTYDYTDTLCLWLSATRKITKYKNLNFFSTEQKQSGAVLELSAGELCKQKNNEKQLKNKMIGNMLLR
jgi:stress response protein SCP2